MPTYYSVRKGHEIELRPGGHGEVKTAFGMQKVPFKPMVIRFRELAKPFPVFGLAARKGVAGGILTPEDAVAQIRRKANELGPSADDLPESDEELKIELIRKLRDPGLGFGSEFVEVPDANDLPEQGDARDEGLAPPPGMVTPLVGVIVQDEKAHRAHCRVCDLSMDLRGINGHSKSKKHLANLQEYEADLKQAAGY